MRIVIANWHRNVVGGAEAYLRALIPDLLNRGHEVGLVHGYQTASLAETVDPAHGMSRWCHQELGTQSVLKQVSQWKPDVVYTHGLESLDLESALVGAQPSVLFAHGYYGTCATGRKCHASPHFAPCSRRFGPMCLVLHYPSRCGGLHPVTAIQRYRVEASRNALLPRYRAILVASRHMYQEFANHGVDPQRLDVLPLPATDFERDASAPVFRLPEGRILVMGRLTDLKGVAHLVRAIPAASRLLNRPLRLVVAGSGSEEKRLRLLALNLSVPTEFIGWLSGSRRRELIRDSDLLAVPSVWPEPFGLVGIEAAACGLPAVGYAVGGVPEWLIPGVSGELAPGNPPTEQGLTSAIVRALEDPAHYNALRVGAWQVSRRFSLPAHLDALEAVLEKVARLRPAEMM